MMGELRSATSRNLASVMSVVILASAYLLLRMSSPADAATTIDATCNPALAQHYRSKGIVFTNRHDYRDASFAFAASIQAINKCPPGTLNLVWAYYALMFEAAADLGLGDYPGAEKAIGWARDVKARLDLMNLSAANRAAVHTNDENISKLERGLVAAQAAQLSAQQRALYLPPISGSYGEVSAEPDCDDETIDEVKDDGKVLVMLSGAVFLVNDVDTPVSSIWLTTDDVKACTGDGRHYRLIDGTGDASATKIQN
jgi:hypothetical protein